MDKMTMTLEQTLGWLDVRAQTERQNEDYQTNNREMTAAQKAYAKRALEIINAGIEGDARDAANAVRLDAAEKLAASRKS